MARFATHRLHWNCEGQLTPVDQKLAQPILVFGSRESVALFLRGRCLSVLLLFCAGLRCGNFLRATTYESAPCGHISSQFVVRQ